MDALYVNVLAVVLAAVAVGSGGGGIFLSQMLLRCPNFIGVIQVELSKFPR